MNAFPAYALALIGACIVIEVVYQTSFKIVAARSAGQNPIRAIVSQPLLWIAIILWGAEVIGWIAVLRQIPLSFAYPIMALTYAGVPLAGFIALRERMTASQIAGAALVLIGVLAVSMSGGDTP